MNELDREYEKTMQLKDHYFGKPKVIARSFCLII